jgi:hypothetical protein
MFPKRRTWPPPDNGGAFSSASDQDFEHLVSLRRHLEAAGAAALDQATWAMLTRGSDAAACLIPARPPAEVAVFFCILATAAASSRANFLRVFDRL